MIEKVVAFIVENWRLLLEFVLTLIALVLFIVRKRSVKVVDGIYSALIKVIPGFILFAEEKYGAGKGDIKLETVISLATAYINKLYPGITDFTQYIEFIKNQVEVILSTPQKKGE